MNVCKPWLDAEIAAIKPKVIIALGVTAATSILGRLVKIGEERSRDIKNNAKAETVIVSWHPSSILRAYSTEDRDQKIADLKEDLARAWRLSF